jgi:hypothetical protein
MTDSTPIELTTRVISVNGRAGVDMRKHTHIGFTGVEEESNSIIYQLGEESTRVVHSITLKQATESDKDRIGEQRAGGNLQGLVDLHIARLEFDVGRGTEL